MVAIHNPRSLPPEHPAGGQHHGDGWQPHAAPRAPQERQPAPRLFAPPPSGRVTSEALRKLYLDHVVFLMALARTLGVRQPADQEDVVHEAFCIAWRKRGTYDPARGTERGWLAGILIHECQRWRGLACNRLPHSDDWIEERHDTARSPEQRSASAQIEALVRALVDQLPEAQRLALELVELHGLTFEEAAAALRVPVSTAKDRYYKGKTELERKVARLAP